MKKWVYLFLFCCYLPLAAQENPGDSIKTYMDEARQRKVSTYEKLAECYHRGEEVEHNFMNMVVMYSWAADLGGRPVAEYMHHYGEDDPDRLLFDGMEAVDRKQYDEAEVKAGKLEVLGNPGVVSLKAILAMRRGEAQEKVDSLLLLALGRGCSLAKINYVVGREERLPDSEYEKRLEEISPQIPMAYNLLGKFYYDRAVTGNDRHLMEKVRLCFEHADKYACLSTENAKRLQCIVKHLAKFHG